MVWFKIDDQFWSHPKVHGLTPESGWLWTRAGSYCGQHLTDGFVSLPALKMLDGTEALAEELIDAGLWLRAERGYQFHDWHQFQPTKESVIADREAAAERMRQLRSGKRSGEHKANVPPKSRGTNGKRSPSPSPVPSPVPSPKTSNTSQSSPEGKRDVLDGLNLDAVIQELDHAADIRATEDEAGAFSRYVIANAKTAVSDPTAYVKRAAGNAVESGDWFTKHRRRAVA